MSTRVWSRSLTRRSLLAGVAGAAGMPLLAACQVTPPPTPETKIVEKVVTQVVERVVEKPVEKVVEKQVVVTAVPAPMRDVKLEMWFDQWGPDAVWAQLYKEIKERTGVTLNGVVVPYADLEAKTLTSLAGGLVPDIIFNHPIFTATWSKKGVAVALDDYIKGSKAIKLEDFMPGALEYNRWEGKYWGLPIDFETTVYFYNKELLQKAALEDPGDVWKKDAKAWNLDLFRQYATKLSTGEGNSKIYGAGEIPKSLRVQAPWIWGHDGELFSPDFKETLIAAPGALKAWDYLAGHVKNGWSPAVAGRSNNYNATMTPLFNDSRVGFHYTIRGYLTNVNHEKLKLGMVPTPTMPNGMQVTRCAPDSFSVTTKTKEKDAAWAALEVLIIQGSELLVLAKSASPNRLSLLQSKVWTSSLLPWESNDMWVFANKTAKASVLPPKFNEVDKTAQAAYDKIALGESSAQDAMTAAKKQIDATLKEAMA